jgi:endoglucanase
MFSHLSRPTRVLAAAAFTGSSLFCGAQAASNPAGFEIRRGTNLSHWLSQDFGWTPRAIFITENDLKFIARCGFDHVRIPIDEKELWAEDGTPNEEAFGLLLRGIGWARAAGLRVIVDLHTIRSHHFNAANEGGPPNTLWTDPKEQEHFLSLWAELSRRLRVFPVDAVAYEIMNEPVADDHEDWNKLINAAHQLIRASEPDRVLVFGSNLWQIPSTLPALKVPAGDKNIILSTHTYSPLLFTHYRAEWTPLKVYTGPVQYPGPVVDQATLDQLLKGATRNFVDVASNAAEDWNRERIRRELAPAIKRARELGLQLYCGEFGCLPTVPRADRLAYYRDIIAVFESEGMAWANWEYKGDFGIFEWFPEQKSSGAPDNELIDALLHRR